MAEPRLVAAVRRDVAPALAAGAGGVAALFALDLPRFVETWDGSYSWWYAGGFSLIAVQAWGWILTLWSLGMRAAAFQRPLPRTAGAAAMPYFLIHQPVIVAVAFLVVQWQAGIPAKWLAIAVPSALLTAALSVAVSRVPVVCVLFGVKPQRRTRAVAITG